MSDRRIIVLLLTSLIFIIPAVIGAEVSVRIPDAALENAIRETLREWDKELTDSDLAKLSSLIAQNKNIRDLRGLEYAVNLKKLDLANNSVTDLAPLAGLRSLENLNLKWNRVSDISPLRNLTGLTYLSLENNNVAGISHLSGLTNLQRLNLGQNRIHDLTPLRNLVRLEQLVAYFNQISDISALAGLTRLQVVNLSDNHISNIAPLIANLERGGLKDAFVNLTNNKLNISEGSTTSAHIKKLRSAHVEVNAPSQSSAGGGTLEPAVEIKRPGGVPRKAEAEDPGDVRVEPEMPHVEQGSLNLRLMQFLLVFAVLLLATIAYVGYRLALLLMQQRKTPM